MVQTVKSEPASFLDEALPTQLGSVQTAQRHRIMHALGWGVSLGYGTLASEVLRALKVRTKAESWAHNRAHGMSTDGQVAPKSVEFGGAGGTRTHADYDKGALMMTGDVVQRERERRFQAWCDHVDKNDVKPPDGLGAYMKGIIADHETWLREVGAWDDLPKVFKDIYERDAEQRAPKPKRKTAKAKGD